MSEDLEKWKALFKQKLLHDNASYNEIRDILIEMRDGGLDSSFAYKVLEDLRTSMKLTEVEENRLLDLMDIVVGWCSPSARIW